MQKTLKILLGIVLILSITIGLFMQQTSFGKLPSGDRLSRIKNSRNYKKDIFTNMSETQLLAKGASYLGLVTKYFAKGTGREPQGPLPSVKTNLKSLADKPSIVWFGHSSFLISIDGKKILVDPVFSERPSPVQYVGSKSYPGTMVYTANDIPPLDLIIISHDHYDHLDYNTITALKDKTKFFCTPLGVGEHLTHWGIPANQIKEYDWWDGEMVLPGIDLTCTPARHFSGRGLRSNKTLWASFVLKTGGYSIFIGGDSGYDDAFKEIGEQFGPFDIAMLECGQYDVQWPDIHMMPEQTIQATLDLNANVLMPIHWGKFTLALHPWDDPIERALARAEQLNVKITTPMIGEPVFLKETLPVSTWWRNNY